MDELDNILQTYTLSEILEYNEKTEEEVLEFLIRHRYIRLPEYLPL